MGSYPDWAPASNPRIVTVTNHREKNENPGMHESPPGKLSEGDCRGRFVYNSSFGSSDSSFIFVIDGKESKVAIHDILSTVDNIEQRTGIHDRVLLLWH